MRLANPTGYFADNYGLAKAVDILADAGFDALDFTTSHGTEFCSDEHPKEYYLEIRRRAEDKGISFIQAHAPHGSSFADEAKTEKRFGEIVCSMRNAALLGVKNIIVHPCQHLKYREEGVPEKLFEINMDFYRRLLPYAEEYGIRICTENMFQGDMHILNVHSTCSRPAEMIRYFDEINHELFGCCLDIGHTSLVREDAASFIRALGKKRLACLHVHDVDNAHDRHLPPYFGSAIAWDRVLSALAEIGYEGDLTYEADYIFKTVPAPLAPSLARLMADVGHTLISRFHVSKEV